MFSGEQFLLAKKIKVMPIGYDRFNLNYFQILEFEENRYSGRGMNR